MRDKGGQQDSQEIKIRAIVACGERKADDAERGFRIGGGGRAKIKTICGLNLLYCSQLKAAGRSWLIHQNKHFLDGHELHRPVSY